MEQLYMLFRVICTTIWLTVCIVYIIKNRKESAENIAVLVAGSVFGGIMTFIIGGIIMLLTICIGLVIIGMFAIIKRIKGNETR